MPLIEEPQCAKIDDDDDVGPSATQYFGFNVYRHTRICDIAGNGYTLLSNVVFRI